MTVLPCTDTVSFFSTELVFQLHYSLLLGASFLPFVHQRLGQIW